MGFIQRKKHKETYGNDFRSGKKNIDDLHKQLIQDLMNQSRQDDKFKYIFADVIEIMKGLGWEATNTIITQVAGTFKKDKFIVIKNESLNPHLNSKVLSEGDSIPVIV